MNLYSVLLVDDEEEVYSVIMKKLDWEAMGFRIAGYARNGRGNPAGCCDDRHQNAIHGRTDLKQEIKRTISENKNYYFFWI